MCGADESDRLHLALLENDGVVVEGVAVHANGAIGSLQRLARGGKAAFLPDNRELVGVG